MQMRRNAAVFPPKFIFQNCDWWTNGGKNWSLKGSGPWNLERGEGNVLSGDQIAVAYWPRDLDISLLKTRLSSRFLFPLVLLKGGGWNHPVKYRCSASHAVSYLNWTDFTIELEDLVASPTDPFIQLPRIDSVHVIQLNSNWIFFNEENWNVTRLN